jgi:2-octaprenyl-6-methoxyphenol hydroxylase
MTEFKCKALAVGGGPAGLATAGLLAQAGVDTVCLAPIAADDQRTVAIMEPSLRLLRSLGVWDDALQAACAPLEQLHIIDDTGDLVTAPDLRFHAEEVGLKAFGWNVPLTVLLPALRARAIAMGARVLGTNMASATLSDMHIAAVTTSGEQIEAEFAVAADGRLSALRGLAGIKVDEWSYDQSALVTRFQHSRTHEYVSTEWHKRGGPFTTVPMAGNASALVWMDKPDVTAARAALPLQALAREIQLQNHGSLGLISDVAKPTVFAMRGVKADVFAARRVFLVGEAAHVFPPVGAQGLNMSMRDAGHVLDVVLAHDDPGCAAAMQEYQSLRLPDVLPRQTAISFMNRSLLLNDLAPNLLRVAGLAAVSAVPMIRKLALREGLSPSGKLPFVMRSQQV